MEIEAPPLVPAAGSNDPDSGLLGIGRGLLKSATPLDWTTRAALLTTLTGVEEAAGT
jgi:hypothetical protein